MNYVNLGKTGVQVSQLCFGTMSFGAEADEKMSGRMFTVTAAPKQFSAGCLPVAGMMSS
jgi:aryl-alcohol dehydrogenase-like predicted oxidoreductase